MTQMMQQEQVTAGQAVASGEVPDWLGTARVQLAWDELQAALRDEREAGQDERQAHRRYQRLSNAHSEAYRQFVEAYACKLVAEIGMEGAKSHADAVMAFGNSLQAVDKAYDLCRQAGEALDAARGATREAANRVEQWKRALIGSVEKHQQCQEASSPRRKLATVASVRGSSRQVPAVAEPVDEPPF